MSYANRHSFKGPILSLVGMLALLAVPVARAADPPSAVPSSPPARHSRPTAAQHAAVAAKGTPAAAAAAPVPPQRMDFRLGDLRRFFTPVELQSPLPTVVADDVVVETRRSSGDATHESAPVPQGLIAPFWALANPLESWRIFVPDPHAPGSGPPNIIPTLQSAPLPY